ncbi:MAG: asparagine--tRNA ligase, partial [Clostridiaceae bacterium]|nr:asparagine--tRNA ligase [Clostridiaceae bacterium]
MAVSITIRQLYKDTKEYVGITVTVSGWVRTIRDSKSVGFIEMNDGSFFKNLQVVFERDLVGNFDEIARLSSGSAITVEGNIVETPVARQPFELKASGITIESVAMPDYPLQKKRHSFEF